MEKLNRKGFFSTLFGGIAGVVAGSTVKASEPIVPTLPVENVVTCEKRVDTHNRGGGGAAKYTKARLPVRLVYTECFNSKSEAMKREYQIKQLTRQQKLKLIREKQ